MRVMVNGLPGKMAKMVAEYVVKDEELELCPWSLTGEDVIESTMKVCDLEINLLKPSTREMFIDNFKFKPDVTIDYTHPNAVNLNTEFYCKNGLHFVMGTTGGDREAIEKAVQNSDIIAVVATNMAKQIVAFQSMLKYAADTFPNAFKGYTLEIIESHQKGKADTSGTAKSMVNYFNDLGIPFTKEQIIMVREPSEQLKMGISENALKWHAWHTYTLKSDDGNVLFRFTHNVYGADIYAAGTIDAVKYLGQKIAQENKGKVYTMMDVLKGI